ncbi:hypothetical protein BDN70DRAFT_879136 [Pholiota conissans]|uniref:Uncharacterized protein n=1 Tax=Pholiota conissans TaxID=109636 RepID=A0A9P5Z0I2_9AGAR|nr:hypothetical protein BDN70DRAFT_879136 [Pholiota conissans]
MEATNNIITTQGTVQARIDPSLTVNDVIMQLCANLQLKEPPTSFALKDANNELVTDRNLKIKIENRTNLKLVNV